MKSTQTKNKRQLLNYIVLAGLLVGSISATSIPSAMGQSSEETATDLDKMYDQLMEQYNAILASFGFVEPKLTEAQEKELEDKLAALDAEYEKVYESSDGELTAQDETKMNEIDKKYDAILKSYGFSYPELTEAQEKELEDKLAALDEKFFALDAKYEKEYAQYEELTKEQEKKLDALDKQYDATLREYGIVSTELTEAQEKELEDKLAALDAEYEKVYESSDIEEKYGELDAKYTAILSEYGFVEPKLTEAQEKELEDKLAALDAEYEKVYNENTKQTTTN